MDKAQNQGTNDKADDSTRLSLNRHYPVTPEKIWRAWTDPQALSQWFGSGQPGSVTAAEFDLQVGGRFRIAFTGNKGESNECAGVYQEVQPFSRLVFSFFWKSTPERVSRVTMVLTPDDKGTRLDFVHDRFFDTQARDNHRGGWTQMLGQLGDFLDH